MTPIQYLDFDLAIEKTDSGYRAHVLDSPNGQAAANFPFTLNDDEINALITGMGQPRLRGGKTDKNERAAAAKAFGKQLFDMVFVQAVRECWKTSLALADAQEKGLRLRLRLTDVPELADLPWELMYDDASNRFVNLSANTPLVRYLDSPYPSRSLQIQPPLRILGVLSLPEDYDDLAVEREWEQLKDSLGALLASGLMELYRLEEARTAKLQEALRKREYHILHFIGHGELDEKTGEGKVVFENERGRGRLVSGEMLGTLLRDARSLRLVVLNACEGARQARSDPFGGVAQRLVQQKIPAVIAMQFEITDRAALAFSKEFYAALADNYPIEAAVGEARKAIFSLPNETEWATPVLYSRSPTGLLFDVRGAPTPPPTKPAPPAAPTAQPEPLAFDVLMQRAQRARSQGERILAETPVERDAWLPKFQEAQNYLERADALQPDNPRVLLAMLQTQARLTPENPARARELARRIEDLIADTDDANEKCVLAQTYLLHATLMEPPNENLLERAGNLFLQVGDMDMTEVVRQILRRVERDTARSFADLYGKPDARFRSPDLAPRAESPAVPETAAFEFNPIGKWNFQIKDDTGSRMVVEFVANGTFQMTQQIGMYEVPVNGKWSFNPLTRSLTLQGAINTFQRFALNLTIIGKLGDTFTATDAEGISYLLMRHD
jgi:hypothetical protein